MSPPFSTKFLVRPAPLDDEYILSYLERLRIENGYSSIDLICKTIFATKISLVDIVKGNFDKGLFSKYTNLDYEVINNLCITDNKFYTSLNVHLCLECFKEINYIKKEWYLKNYICNQHKLPIVCRCFCCNLLFSFGVLSSPVCKRCFNSIFINVNFKLNTSDHITDVFNIFHKILNFKSFAPNSLSYSARSFSVNFNKSYDFLINKNRCFELHIRKIFFNDRFYSKDVCIFVNDYIYFMININNIICEIKYDEFTRGINGIIRKYSIQWISLGVENSLKSKLKFNYPIRFHNDDYIRYYFLSYENCVNVFLFDSVFIRLLCFNKVFRVYNGLYIDIYSVLSLCINIKAYSTDVDLLYDYVYFKDLKYSDQLIVIKNLPLGGVILYNFNCIDVFREVKIHVNDLKYMSI